MQADCRNSSVSAYTLHSAVALSNLGSNVVPQQVRSTARAAASWALAASSGGVSLCICRGVGRLISTFAIVILARIQMSVTSCFHRTLLGSTRLAAPPAGRRALCSRRVGQASSQHITAYQVPAWWPSIHSDSVIVEVIFSPLAYV